MSNKKYSLSYQLLEKKEINVYSSSKEEKIIKEVAATLDGFPEIQYDELLKSIKDAIPRGIENIQNFLNNTRISSILSNLGKTKEEVIDDIEDLSDEIEYASEEYTILEVFNELNESNYEFNLTIPDLISNKNISLSFPTVLSLLYIINKSTPIKMQETKKHSLKKIIYEERTETVTQKIINSRSLEAFTLSILEYIKQLNTPRHEKRGRRREIIQGLSKPKKFITILDKIIKTNIENNKQFFTNMAVDIGYLVEDTMLFSQTQIKNLKPSNPVAKTSLALLMLLKTQGTDGSKIIDCRGSSGNWSISFDSGSSTGDFYNSKTFNSIKNGTVIKDTDYFLDIENILIPGSNLDKFDEAINSVKKDVSLIFDDVESNISIDNVLTSEDDSRNPAFDFIFKNRENKFSFIDLKTSNINSRSVNIIPKMGNNQNNSAINAINDLPRLNGLEGNKPMFLGMLKMIYSLYIQDSSNDSYLNFNSYITSYGDVTSSCEHSLNKYKLKSSRENKTGSKSQNKKEFFIHSYIENTVISNALNKLKDQRSEEHSIQSLDENQLEILRNYFSNRNKTINSLETISEDEYIQKINEYLQSHFYSTRTTDNKIEITGIKFKFSTDLRPDDIPYFKSNPIERGIDYLLKTDISDLEGLDESYKSFFYDSNKLKVIKYFLKLIGDFRSGSEEYFMTVQQDYPGVKQTAVKKYNNNVYQKFLSKIAGETSLIVKFSSNDLKQKLIKFLRIPGKETKNYLMYGKRLIKSRNIIEGLDEFIKEAEKYESHNEAVNSDKDIISSEENLDLSQTSSTTSSQKVDSYNRKGKVLREVYSHLFRK